MRQAWSEYVLARDYDQLRFRASSDINDFILSVEDSNLVGVVDMEKVFANCSPDSLIGNEIMLDHLHPNSYGYFLMAKKYSRVMHKRGLLASQDEWAKCDTISDDFLWDNRAVTELDELVAKRKSEYTKSTWPFVANTLKIPSVSATDTLEQLADKVARCTMGWYNAHEKAAAYFKRKNELTKLEREYKALISLDPHKGDPYFELVKIYIEQKRIEEAKYVLISFLQIGEDMQAFLMLKNLMGNTNKRI